MVVCLLPMSGVMETKRDLTYATMLSEQNEHFDEAQKCINIFLKTYTVTDTR